MFGRSYIALFFYGMAAACFVLSLFMPTTKMIGMLWIPVAIFGLIGMAFDETFDVKNQ